MEAPPSLSPLTVLRHGLLRATVCCCFVGSGSVGLAERMRWRRRAGAGDFRYDPLSYALNFDGGDHHGHGVDDHAGGRLDGDAFGQGRGAAAVEAAWKA